MKVLTRPLGLVRGGYQRRMRQGFLWSRVQLGRYLVRCQVVPLLEDRRLQVICLYGQHGGGHRLGKLWIVLRDRDADVEGEGGDDNAGSQLAAVFLQRRRHEFRGTDREVKPATGQREEDRAYILVHIDGDLRLPRLDALGGDLLQVHQLDAARRDTASQAAEVIDAVNARGHARARHGFLLRHPVRHEVQDLLAGGSDVDTLDTQWRPAALDGSDDIIEARGHIRVLEAKALSHQGHDVRLKPDDLRRVLGVGIGVRRLAV